MTDTSNPNDTSNDSQTMPPQDVAIDLAKIRDLAEIRDILKDLSSDALAVLQRGVSEQPAMVLEVLADLNVLKSRQELDEPSSDIDKACRHSATSSSAPRQRKRRAGQS